MFSSQQFIQAVRDTVAERGADYVYQPPGAGALGGKCVYRFDDKPSCLFGHALDKVGVDRLRNGDTLEGFLIDDLLVNLGFFNEAVRTAAVAAQREQDIGRTWGQALAVFEASLREYGYNESATRTM